jgi:hypothetical protein
MEKQIDPNFFVNIAKLYSQLNKLDKEQEDTVIKFGMYIDKELNKTGGNDNNTEIIV